MIKFIIARTFVNFEPPHGHEHEGERDGHELDVFSEMAQELDEPFIFLHDKTKKESKK